jgi:hypothetical protein
MRTNQSYSEQSKQAEKKAKGRHLIKGALFNYIKMAAPLFGKAAGCKQ